MSGHLRCMLVAERAALPPLERERKSERAKRGRAYRFSPASSRHSSAFEQVYGLPHTTNTHIRAAGLSLAFL